MYIVARADCSVVWRKWSIVKEKSLIYRAWTGEASLVAEGLIVGSKGLRSRPQVLFAIWLMAEMFPKVVHCPAQQ